MGTRSKSKAAAGLLSALLLLALAVGCAAAMFPGELDVPAYLVVNAGLLCLHLAMGGFCFFASCLFNESRLSVALGATFPCCFSSSACWPTWAAGWKN